MTTTTTTTRNMTHVRALFPDCVTLSIVDAVAAATDKGAAIDLIARAIVGAALEFGHSGNDARLKSARESLQGKGKGAQVRARAVLAIDAIRDSMKARELVALDDAGIVDWVVKTMAQAVDALTPAPVVRKTPMAKTAPEAATIEAPEAATIEAPEAATIEAPEAAPAVAAILAAIDAGAYSVPDMLRIMAALSKVPGVSSTLTTLAAKPKAAKPKAAKPKATL